METVWTFEHPGMDGGRWYAAAYPFGGTRYYQTPEARASAVARFVGAIEATGGSVVVREA